MTERPCFYINNKPYLSAGVLFYSLDQQGNIYFMLQHVKEKPWKYEDFGGKSQNGDQTIMDVAIRECCEELNEIFDKSFFMKRECIQYLIPDSKYVLYLFSLDPEYINCNTQHFGNHETLTGVKRDVVWLTYRELVEHRAIHPRLVDLKYEVSLLLADTYV